LDLGKNGSDTIWGRKNYNKRGQYTFVELASRAEYNGNIK